MDKMRKTDELIIMLLVILYLLVLGVVLWLDKDIDALNKTLDHLLSVSEDQGDRISALEKETSYQIDMMSEDIFVLDERVDEAELRLDDHVATMVRIKNEIDGLKPTPTPKASQRNSSHKVSVSLTERDIRNIAALVYLEAGSQSYRCQKAIASVVINRMSRYHKSASQVIYEPGVFSVAYRVGSTKPSAESLRAVRDVIKNGTTLPRSVVAFRNGHYHSFGRRYCCIDGVYFSAV